MAAPQRTLELHVIAFLDFHRRPPLLFNHHAPSEQAQRDRQIPGKWLKVPPKEGRKVAGRRFRQEPVTFPSKV